MPYIEANAARLYYEQYGDGPDLLFLHGAGGNHLSWWQQIPVFAKNYRCTVFDARGWGLSRGSHAVGRYVLGADAVALLERLGIERAHIVAQSMGGRAVAGIARLAPARVKSLVLCGTTAGATNDRIRELQDQLRDERGDGGLRGHALAPAFEQENPALALLYRQVNALNPRRPKGFLGRPPATYRGSMHELLSALGVPTLYLVGEHDMITSPEMVREAARLVAGAEHHELPGAGHSAYFEQADVWNGVVQAFLQQAEKRER